MALQVSSKEDIAGEKQITEERVPKESETDDNSSVTVEQQVDIAVPVEANQFKDFIFDAPGFECKECKLKVKTK